MQRRGRAPYLAGMERGIGTLIMLAGGALVLLGLLVWSGAFSWFGRLPGDLRIEGGSTRVFIPVTSMILVSVALTLVINLVLRLLR